MAAAAPVTSRDGKSDTRAWQELAHQDDSTPGEADTLSPKDGEESFSPWNPISEPKNPKSQNFLLSSSVQTLFAVEHVSKQGLGDLGCLLGCARDSQGIQPTSLWSSFSARKTGIAILTLTPPPKTQLYTLKFSIFSELNRRGIVFVLTHPAMTYYCNEDNNEIFILQKSNLNKWSSAFFSFTINVISLWIENGGVPLCPRTPFLCMWSSIQMCYGERWPGLNKPYRKAFPNLKQNICFWQGDTWNH